MERSWLSVKIRHAPREARLPVIVFVAALLAASATVLYFAARLWFFGDDWDYLLHRGTIAGVNRGWFTPHNEHPSIATIGVFRLVFAFFGLHAMPYAIVTLLFHLATVVTVVLTLARVMRTWWIPCILGVVLSFLGAGSSPIFWYNALSFVGSVLFGWLAVFLLARPSPNRNDRLLEAGLACLMSLCFSGIGVSAVVFVATYLLLSRGWRQAAIFSAPLAALFLIWYAVVGRSGGSGESLSGAGLLKLPEYVWTGLSGPLGDLAGIPGSGAILLVAVIAAPFAGTRQPSALQHLAWAGMVAAVLQLVISGVGRLSSQGIDQALTGRYAYLTIVYLSPAIASLLLILARVIGETAQHNLWPVRLLSALLVLGVVVSGAAQMRDYYLKMDPYIAPWKPITAGLLTATADGERILTPEPDSWLQADYDARLITSPRIRSVLPKPAPSAQGMADARSIFMVGVGEHGYDLESRTDLSSVYGFAPAVQTASGCHDYDSTVAGPVLKLSSGQGTEIVVWSKSTKITTQILMPDDVKGRVRDWTVKPGAVHIATSAKDVQLLIGFNGQGRYTICQA